jgi:hypothetical protein
MPVKAYQREDIIIIKQNNSAQPGKYTLKQLTEIVKILINA